MSKILDYINGIGIENLIFYSMAAAVIFIVFAVIYDVARTVALESHNISDRKKAVLLRIRPQNTSDILKTEQLIMFLHGLLLNTKWRAWTEGEPYISYEIVSSYKKIEFYVWVNERYKKSIEEQLYVCYPDCVIEEVEDYLIPLHKMKQKIRTLKKQKKNGEFDKEVEKLQIHGFKIDLGLNFAFPLADKMDIVDSILAAMTGLEWHEKLVLQVLVKPINRSWQVNGRKVIKEYEKKGIHPDSKKGFGSSFSTELSDLKGQLLEEISGKDAQAFAKKKAADNTKTDREEIREAAKKVLKSGFDVDIRILGTGFYGRQIKDRVRAVASAFNKLDYINRTKKKLAIMTDQFYKEVQKRQFIVRQYRNVLTPSELAGFFLRLPAKELLIRELIRNKLKHLPPPLMDFERKQNIVGNIVYKGSLQTFGLKPQDARRHVHIIGGIGVGKTEALKTKFIEAVKAGKGAILLEPHGQLSDEMLHLLAQELPADRYRDVLFYDFSDSEYPVPFNVMKVYFDGSSSMSRADMIDETAEEFMNIMKQIFSDSWGIRTEKIFRHTGKALMEADEGGLWNAKQMLKKRDYRKKIVKKVRNIAVRDFWDTEFNERQQKDGTYKLDSDMKNAIDSPLTKIDRFLSSERILNMVAQEECINFRECINGNKIVIFKIPKGVLKEENTKFIGNIVFSKLMMAFMARNAEEMKHDTLLMADEVQNFVTTNPKSFETLLDELRKYGVQFVMAHQRVSQIESIIGAVMDNIGTTVCFRVGSESSKYMQRVFDKYLDASDLEGLENRYAYVKALVNGQKTEPFLIKTLDKYEVDNEKVEENVKKIIELNRVKRKPKAEVDKELRKRLKETGDDTTDFKMDLDEDYIQEVEKNIKVSNAVSREEETRKGSMPKEWD